MPRACHNLRSIDMKMKDALNGLRGRGYQCEGPVDAEVNGRKIEGYSVYSLSDRKLIATLFRDDERNIRAFVDEKLREEEPCFYRNFIGDLARFNVVLIGDDKS